MAIRYELGILNYSDIMSRNLHFSNEIKTNYKNRSKEFIKRYLLNSGFNYIKFKADLKNHNYIITVGINKVKEVKREHHQRSINPEIDRINFYLRYDKNESIVFIEQIPEGIFSDMQINRWTFRDIKKNNW